MVDLTLSDISKYLTEEVIGKAFKLRTGSEDKVNSIKVAPAVEPGEGLLSVVYRIKVVGSYHSASFVVKGLVADPLLQKTLDCTKYFKREIDFFTKVLPVLSEVQPLLGAKERLALQIPICYSSYHDGSNDYILLEDLAESDCRSVTKTPTDEEKNRVLQILAHYHAVSMALRIKNPEKFTKLVDSLPELYYVEENRDWYAGYLRAAVDVDRKVIAEFEEPDSIYYKKFNDALNVDLYEQYITLANSRGNHPVICHGDSWAPNFMYSRQRMVIVDFQVSRCASLATDLSYWILLTTNHNTTKQHFLNAVDTYYAALQYYLQDMTIDASKIFSRADLDQELQMYGRYGYLASLTTLPLMTADKFDYSKPIVDSFPGHQRVPLEHLWMIKPIENREQKLRIRNAVRVAVDVALI